MTELLTAYTITDGQIHELRVSAGLRRNTWLMGICDRALDSDPDVDVAAYRLSCRARCAEILNARTRKDQT
jgi:hypothetical protein